MTVTGQPAVIYTWDDANRLTQIVQASTTVAFGYDNADRRSALTLPNGITVQYGYDQASRLTALTYMLGTNILGNLTYSFDAANNVVQMGGSFARTGLPQPMASANYDAANQLTNWNGVSFAYDANGNLLTDGSNSYVWNARDQLASLNGTSFQYDGFGRRTQNVVGTRFLYDGVNAVQELNVTTPTANLLSGGLDQVFSRTDSSGISSFLPDLLGSTLALADSSGVLQTLYSYEPFGNTTTAGGSSSNLFQYSGRENDGTGIFYYRSRYYSPATQRFISEDPIGFLGGINRYTYVGGNPVRYRDPLGLNKSDPHSCGDPFRTLRQIQRSAFENKVLPWSDAAGGPRIDTGWPSFPSGPLTPPGADAWVGSPPTEVPGKTLQFQFTRGNPRQGGGLNFERLQHGTDLYGNAMSVNDLYSTYRGSRQFDTDFSHGISDIIKDAGNCSF